MNFGLRKIQASSIPKLDSFALGKINNALNASYDKLQKVVNNEVLLLAHFKQHQQQGRRAKHSVHLKLSFPGKTVVATESGWDAASVAQSALRVLEREVIESVKRR